MLWTMTYSIYTFVILAKAWVKNRDINKYAVIAVFAGITFLNTIEPMITSNMVFWVLELYLAGMVRALYNNAYFPKNIETDVMISYV